MKFTIKDVEWDRRCELIYRSDEYSFDSEPRFAGCVSSVLVNDLELEVDDEGVVVCVTGLCPYSGWQRTERLVPVAKRHTLIIVDESWVPGISKRLTKPYEWPMFVNYQVGCVCIGDPDIRVEAVEFSPGCIAVLDGENLVALWLKPRSLPSEERCSR